jgi:predicted MFS family arabinose efflux permease
MAATALLVVGQMFVTIPLMPELGAAWDRSVAATAWTTTVFGIAYAVGSLASGPLADRYGRRPVIVTGLLAMAVATMLVPLATSLETAVLLRGLQGLLSGSFLPVAYAYLTDRVRPDRLPLALTAVNSTAAATIVIAQVEAQLLSEMFSWRAVFWCTGPMVALSALVLWKIMLPDPPASAGSGSAGGWARLRPLRSVRVMPLLLATVTLIGGLTAVYTGVQLYGPAELLDNPDALLALRASALPAMVIAVVLAQFLGRFSGRARAACSLAVAASGAVAAGLAGDHAVGLAAALFVFVFGISTAGPALVQAIGADAGESRATALAVYAFVLNLGSGIGAQLPLVAGSLPVVAFTLTGALLSAVVLVMWSSIGSRRGAADVPSGQQFPRLKGSNSS